MQSDAIVMVLVRVASGKIPRFGKCGLLATGIQVKMPIESTAQEDLKASSSLYRVLPVLRKCRFDNPASDLRLA